MLWKLSRVTFNVLTVASLVLCVAACVLWVRSYGSADEVQVQREAARWRVVSTEGRLLLDNEPQRRMDREAERLRWQGSGRPWTGPREDAVRPPSAYSVRYRTVAAAAAALPASWLLTGAACGYKRGRALRRLSLCPACGYDLRATPGRCPECGKVPAG